MEQENTKTVATSELSNPLGGGDCKHDWDNAKGIKIQGKPWIGIKSKCVRTCKKCGKKEKFTNDGMFCGWFEE